MSRLLRLYRIQQVFIRYGIEDLLLRNTRLAWLSWFVWILPARWFSDDTRRLPRGQRIRLALEELGPVFVKLGQVLSTRRDLLPDDIGRELVLLQDKVPPFSGELARTSIESSLAQPLSAIFSAFDQTPIASASVAQVHGATLLDGTRVVVKVLRPGIGSVIDRDVSLMYLLADLTQYVWQDARRLRPREVVEEYDHTIHDELDLIREASNAVVLRNNFQHSDYLYIPEIHWDFTRTDVLVMERIDGIPIRDVAAMNDIGMDMEKLAERGVEIFYTQVFKHNFFHADMHPGNIFVSREHPHSPQYIAVDFGIVGSLTDEDQRYLGENFLAFFRRDYRRVAQLHVDSGWVPPDTRVAELEGAIRAVCEPIFDKPLQEISFGVVLLRLFHTARRFNMEVQPQLVLLQKTLLNIEGLGRELYPQLDLWATAKPFLEQWMIDRRGPKAIARQFAENLPAALEVMPRLPVLAAQLAERGARPASAEQPDKPVQAASSRRLANAIAGSAILLSSSVMGAALLLVQGASTLSGVLLGAIALFGLWLVLRGVL